MFQEKLTILAFRGMKRIGGGPAGTHWAPDRGALGRALRRLGAGRGGAIELVDALRTARLIQEVSAVIETAMACIGDVNGEAGPVCYPGICEKYCNAVAGVAPVTSELGAGSAGGGFPDRDQPGRSQAPGEVKKRPAE